MDLSLSSILAGLIFSGIGIWLFREGKRRNNILAVIISILLMVYTLFTKTPLATWSVGIILCFIAYKYWE